MLYYTSLDCLIVVFQIKDNDNAFRRHMLRSKNGIVRPGHDIYRFRKLRLILG